MTITNSDMSITGVPAKSVGAADQRWYQKRPSAKRFLIWNLFCWFFAAACLVGGILYTENIVRPIAESGGFNFNPAELMKKEESGKRAFGALDRMNILVLGIDYNHDSKGIIYTKGARSDTMMVVSLSREGDLLNVVSIPRDCRVYIGDDYGYEKINAAYSFGGVEQAKEVVSRFLGIPIHHYLIVKVYGAQKMIDAIGGLPIDVEKDMDYDDNWGGLHIHLKKGVQVLNGTQTVGYARFRHDEESDRGRIRRQQQVIRALGSKLKEPALALRFPQLAELVRQTLDTDLMTMEMIDLANLYLGFDFKKMRSGAIVGDDAIDSYGASYIEPYAPENEKTVRRLLKSSEWLSRADLRIKIYYKAAAPDIADRFADRLAEAGFESVSVQALPLDDKRDTSHTYLAWNNRIARLEGIVKAVIGALPEQSRTQTSDPNQDEDVVLVIGDNERGNLKDMPAGLKQPKSTNTYRDSGARYNSNYYAPTRYSAPTEPEPSSYPEDNSSDDGIDVTAENYPKAPASGEKESGGEVPVRSSEGTAEKPSSSHPSSHPTPAPVEIPVSSAPAAPPTTTEAQPEPNSSEMPVPMATPIGDTSL